MRERSFVNQRLIRFTSRKKNGGDFNIHHALLNSLLGVFYIEALGFGRGLGALDLNATKNRKRLHMLNPAKLNTTRCDSILSVFQPLLKRAVLPLKEELKRDDRREFDRTVFEAFGISEVEEQVRKALINLYAIRMAAIT